MVKNIGFPKLELSLSAMTKDDLADSLAYNSLKVYTPMMLCLLVFSVFMFSHAFFVIRA
jgi:hypothetical protein